MNIFDDALNGIGDMAKTAGSAVSNAAGGIDLTKNMEPSAASNMLGMLGLGKTPERRAAEAAADGMKVLAAEYQKDNDPQRAMLRFVQTPDGQKVMAVPGAFKAMADDFQKQLLPQTPQAVQLSPGAVGGIYRPGFSEPLQTQGPTPRIEGVPSNSTGFSVTPGQPPQKITTAAPTAIGTPPGGRNDIYGGGTGEPQGTVNNPTTDVQNVQNIMKNFGGNMSPDQLNTLAQIHLAPQAAQWSTIQHYVQQGLMTPDQGKGLLTGTLKIMPKLNMVGEPTGQYVLFDMLKNQSQDVMPGQHTVPGAGGAQPSQGSPAGAAGGAGPQTQSQPQQTGSPITSTMPEVTPPVGRISFGNPGGAATPSVDQFVKKVASDPQIGYNIPPDAVDTDGKLDVFKAFGNKADMFLGLGPAPDVQRWAGAAARWFDITNPDAAGIAAQHAHESLQQLETALLQIKTPNNRIKDLANSWLKQGPHGERVGDPVEGIVAGIQLYDNLTNQMNIAQRNAYDNSTSKEFQKAALEEYNTLYVARTMLPNRQAMVAMQAAMQQGVIPVPNIKGAAGSVVSAAKAVGKGVSDVAGDILWGGFNGKPSGQTQPSPQGPISSPNQHKDVYLKQIPAMSESGLMQFRKQFKSIDEMDPALRAAYGARLNALTSRKNGGQGPALPFAPEGQSGALPQFLSNPDQGRTQPSMRKTVKTMTLKQEEPAPQGNSPFDKGMNMLRSKAGPTGMRGGFMGATNRMQDAQSTTDFFRR